MNQLPWPLKTLKREATPAPADFIPAEPVTGSVFFSVCLPPPVHGQALVNASVVRAAQAYAPAEKIVVEDIGPGGNKFGLKYHLTRLRRVLHAGAGLLRGGVAPGRRLYTVFESGYGVVYNFLLIGLARLLGYDVVLHHHTSEHSFVRQGRFALLQRLAGPRCLNVALSDDMAENLRLLYPELRPVMVSHNACHIPAPALSAADRRAAPRQGRLRIGFLSNLCREKGLDVVLDVARQCRARDLDVTFVLAGPTVGEDAAALLKEGQDSLGDMIEAIGPVGPQAKAEFFDSIDVFLFPTRYRYEAQPLVLLEAMSYGLRIVTTNCGFISELVGDHGAVFDPDEHLVEDIVDEVERMVRAPDLVRRGAEGVEAHFLKLRAMAFDQLRQLTQRMFAPASRSLPKPPPLASLPLHPPAARIF